MNRKIQMISQSKSKNLKVSIGLPAKHGTDPKEVTEKAICFYRDLLATLSQNDANFSIGSKAEYLRLSFADDFEMEEENLEEDMPNKTLLEDDDYWNNEQDDYYDEWYDK